MREFVGATVAAPQDGPLVSVIIPAHDAAATIAGTIRSALNQTYRRLEVLVVDDGSCDGTADIVQSLARDGRVSLLRQANRGVAAARNAAIARAAGDYIAPLDADDLWHPTKIEKQVLRLESAPSVGLVYCWWDVVNPHGRLLARSHPWRLEGWVADSLLAMNFVGNASVPLFRRTCLDAVGGYDPDFHGRGAQGCEDWDLALRIAERYEVAVVPERLVAYRQMPGSMSTKSAAMIRSHELLLAGTLRRRPDLPASLLRLSRGQLYGYLIMTAARNGDVRGAVRCMLNAALSTEVSFRSPLVAERLLGSTAAGVHRLLRASGARVGLRAATAHPAPASPAAPPLDTREAVASAAGGAGPLMVLSNGLQLVISAAAVAVLARLLVPADFGLFALVAVVLGLVANLRDFGIPAATIRIRAITDAELSALFWLNAILAVLLALCTIAAAPLLARFFGEPALLGITVAMTAGGLIASASALHLGLLAREMRFGAVAATEIGATAAGALIGVVAALRGAGYWALVLQHVGMMTVIGVVPWLLCRWRPRGFSGAGGAQARSLLGYGTNLSLSRLVVYGTQSAAFVVVGRMLGAGALGLYQTAYRWATLPVQQVFKPLDQVVVSSLRPLHDDPARYRAAMAGTIRATAALVLPLVALVGVAAGDVVLLLLGRQWVDAVPLLRVLAAAAFLDVVRLSCKWLHLSEGRTDRQLRWALISMPFVLLGTGLGLAWGALGVALGFTAAILALAVPTAHYTLATSPLSAREFWGALAHPAAAAVIAAIVAAVMLPFLTPIPPAARLAALLSVMVISYAVAWIVLPGGRTALHDVLQRARAAWPTRLRLAAPVRAVATRTPV